MPKSLFFVDSIFTPIESQNSIVTLLSTEEDGEAIVLNLGPEQLQMSNHQGTIREGWYVFYSEDRQSLFRYGNLSLYAREQFGQYYELRSQLLERTIDMQSEEAMIPYAFLDPESHVDVTSYHLNVGHGNCSILLVECKGFYQLWMVDCSLIDKTDRWHNYQKSLVECFKAIARKLGKQEDEPLHIDRFFLTHPHHDHYSGIDYLVNHNHIDGRTVFYMNLYYQMASKAYNKVLTTLRNANVRFVEPISGNSNDVIRFLHPECRLYRSKATIKSATAQYRIVRQPVNDASVVVMIQLGNKAMVFPGDLEQNGFKAMTVSTQCSPFLCNSDYYIVSHHGSLNGHPSIPCFNPAQPLPSPLNCASSNLIKSVVMGRDGAYSGIYSPVVTRYWSSIGRGLEYTEIAPHFIELKWGSGNVVIH